MKKLSFILLGALVFGLVFPGRCESLNAFEQTGPFPVGVTTHLFRDYTRIDPKKGTPRPLPTEIWYPAADGSETLPKNQLSDFYGGVSINGLAGLMKMAMEIDFLEAIRVFKNNAVRDARVRPGKYPLVLFSHGNGGVRFQNIFLCEHLASHGFIVVSPDHTNNCSLTAIEGKLTIYDEEGREQAALDRPKDISFLIDAMEGFTKGGDSRFTGKVDMDHIAVVGHSFGGYTAAAVADMDERVDAIAPIAAVGRERTRYDCPVLVILATEDATIKEEGNARMRSYFEESKGPHFLVEFLNAGHFSFTEMGQFKADFGDGIGEGKRITNGEAFQYLDVQEVHRITNGYVLAFLKAFLKDDSSCLNALQENPNPEELIVKAVPSVE